MSLNHHAYNEGVNAQPQADIYSELTAQMRKTVAKFDVSLARLDAAVVRFSRAAANLQDTVDSLDDDQRYAIANNPAIRAVIDDYPAPRRRRSVGE
jgi:hypothetical protein